jgi:hypothetical protein
MGLPPAETDSSDATPGLDKGPEAAPLLAHTPEALLASNWTAIDAVTVMMRTNADLTVLAAHRVATRTPRRGGQRLDRGAGIASPDQAQASPRSLR